MLLVNNIEVGYGESLILRNVSLSIQPGQVVCLTGRNGVGKTTFLKTVIGLLKPRSGQILWKNEDITSIHPAWRAKLGIAYVPQGRDIFPQLTVDENLLLGLEASRVRQFTIPAEIFDIFPILKSMLTRKGGDLSGGQQQQLAIARALISKPDLLLLDEPMEGIQPSVVQEIEQVIRSLKEARRTSVLLVEQSIDFALDVADTYYVLDKGCVVAEGSTDQLDYDDVRQHLLV